MHRIPAWGNKSGISAMRIACAMHRDQGKFGRGEMRERMRVWGPNNRTLSWITRERRCHINRWLEWHLQGLNDIYSLVAGENYVRLLEVESCDCDRSLFGWTIEYNSIFLILVETQHAYPFTRFPGWPAKLSTNSYWYIPVHTSALVLLVQSLPLFTSFQPPIATRMEVWDWKRSPMRAEMGTRVPQPEKKWHSQIATLFRFDKCEDCVNLDQFFWTYDVICTYFQTLFIYYVNIKKT